MTEQLWIQVLIWFVGIVIFIANNAYKFGQLKADFATKQELKDKVYERDEKIKGVYHALDKRHEEYNGPSGFVRKDMCKQAHEFGENELKAVKDDHKEYRHEQASTVEKIFLTIDFLRKDFSDLKEAVLKK